MKFTNSIITPQLVSKVLCSYALDVEGIHGINHWIRVERNALQLAESEGVESDIFSLFALFHDARRQNEARDKEHGKHGAMLARELHTQGDFPLSADELDRLCYACEHHTDQKHNADPIIGICWDADRLDLTRIGTVPNPLYLNSATAIGLACENYHR